MTFQHGFGSSGSPGTGSANVSSGKGVSGTNKNPDTSLFCGDSTICHRTVKVEGVTKDSDTTATIQLDYKSSGKVYGYQFVIEFDSSLTLTSPELLISERAGSQPGFQISTAQSLGSNRFLVFGFFSSAGTFLAPAETDTNFLTVAITTSNNAFAGLSSADVTNKTSIVYSSDNINSPLSPNPVFATNSGNNIKNDSWTGFSSNADFNTFTSELADIYQSGLIFDSTNWNKSKDTRLKGYYDITDLCSHKLFRISGSKFLFDYICEEQMLSDSDCTICESPKDIAKTSDCDSEICILNSVASEDGKEAIITFGYKSTCRISGYEITLGGIKPRADFSGVGGALKILQLDDQEAHKKQWLENLGRDPALSNSDRLTYNAPEEKINTRIFGLSFGRLLHENEDKTIDFGDLNSTNTAWSLPSTGGKFKKLTRISVNLESFTSIPILSSFKLVTSETLKQPANDYSNNWTGIDLNSFLGSVSHTEVDVKDLMACLYYYREGFGAAETSPYDSLNTFTQRFISEAGRSELSISDVLAVGNRLTFDAAPGSTPAEIVPSDCCSITLPGDFTLSGTFIACNQSTDPGKISLAIGQSTSATGYKIYRKTRIISESYKTPDSVLANKFVKEGVVRTEDLYRTKLEFLTTLSTHQTYVDLPIVPVRDCSISHDATYYVIAFNNAGEVAKEVTVSYNCCDEEGAAIITPDITLTRVMNSEIEIFLPVTYNGAPAFFGSKEPPETAKLVKAFLTSAPTLGGTIDLSFADEGKFIYKPPVNVIGKAEFTYTARAMSTPEGPNLSIESPGIVTMNIIPPIPDFTATSFGCGKDNGKVAVSINNELGNILDVTDVEWKVERKLSTDPDSSYSVIKTFSSFEFVNEQRINFVDEVGIAKCCNADVILNYRVTSTAAGVTSQPTIVSVTIECCALENVRNFQATASTTCSDANHPENTITWKNADTTTSGKTVLQYKVYRKGSTDSSYQHVGTVSSFEGVANGADFDFTFKDKKENLPNANGFNSSLTYEYAVVTIAVDGSVSGDPNDSDWATGTAGNSCSVGGSKDSAQVANCSTAPCPQDASVDVCAGDTDFTIQINYGCVIKDQQVGLLFAETSGTAPSGLVTIDTSSGVATIDTTGVAIGSYTQNFTLTDTLGQSGSGVLTINVIDCDCGCYNSNEKYLICDLEKKNKDWTESIDTTVLQVPPSILNRPNPRGPTSPESQPPIITQSDDADPPPTLIELPPISLAPPPGVPACSVLKIVGVDYSGLSFVEDGQSSVTFSVSGVGNQDCAQKFHNLETPYAFFSSNWGSSHFTNSGTNRLTTTWNSDYSEVTFSWQNRQDVTASSTGDRFVTFYWGRTSGNAQTMQWGFKFNSNTGEIDSNHSLGKLLADNTPALISPPYHNKSDGISSYNNRVVWGTAMQGSAQRLFEGPQWKLDLTDVVFLDTFKNAREGDDAFRGAVTMTIGGTDYYLIGKASGIDSVSHRMNSQVTSGRTAYVRSNGTSNYVEFKLPDGEASSLTVLGYHIRDTSGTKFSVLSEAPDNATDVTFYFPANISDAMFGGSEMTHSGARSDLKIVISMNDGTHGNMTVQGFRSDDGSTWTAVDRIYLGGHDYE